MKLTVMIVAFVIVGLADPLLLAGKWFLLGGVGALLGLVIAATLGAEPQAAQASMTDWRWHPAIPIVVAVLGFVALRQLPVLNARTLFFASALQGFSAMTFSFALLSLLSSLRKAAQ